MPLFYRVKLPNGTFAMQEQPQPIPEPIQVVAPASPTVGGVGMKRYSCTACSPTKSFASAGVMSMHFLKVHKDLWESKNSWRKHVLEFGDLK